MFLRPIDPRSSSSSLLPAVDVLEVRSSVGLSPLEAATLLRDLRGLALSVEPILELLDAADDVEPAGRIVRARIAGEDLDPVLETFRLRGASPRIDGVSAEYLRSGPLPAPEAREALADLAGGSAVEAYAVLDRSDETSPRRSPFLSVEVRGISLDRARLERIVEAAVRRVRRGESAL